MTTSAPGNDRLPTSPNAAHQAQLALLYRVLLAVAARRQDDLPGLTEACQDNLLLADGHTTRRVRGYFAENIWRYGDRSVHELFLNADRRHARPWVSRAEDLFITLLHEACHVWAQANDIQDTSRQGRWHNRKFGEIARKIGLVAEPDTRIGHTTPRLTSWARAEYTDLLSELEAGLVLAREPERPRREPGAGNGGQSQSDASPGAEASSTPYVSASCRCQLGRRPVTIRIASGNWRPGVIFCAACQDPFES